MSDLRPDPVAEELAIESPPGELGESSLSAVALRGVALNWVGAVVLVIGQIVSTVITARLVDPAGFGAYATAQAAAGFLGYFTLMGLGPGVQRRERLGPKTLPTALVLSGAAAALVSAVLFAAAEPWSRAWGSPTRNRRCGRSRSRCCSRRWRSCRWRSSVATCDFGR